MKFSRSEKTMMGAAFVIYACLCAFVVTATPKPTERSPAAVSNPMPATTPSQQVPIVSLIPLPQVKRDDVLVLSARNTYTFRGVVTPDSVARAQQALIALSGELDEDDTIYLALDTPGGDVISGNTFIDTVNALPQKVKTVTVFAASMGFHFAQNMDERLITPSGVLMSHRAKMGMQGEVPGEFITRLNFFLRVMLRMDTQAAKRMGLEVGKYQELIRDEYWVDGQDAVAAKAADKVVLIRCAADMLETEQVAIRTMFGTLNVTFSKCPLISGPVAVDSDNLTFPSDETKTRFYEQLDTLLNDKKSFVRLFIKTDEYKTYFVK